MSYENGTSWRVISKCPKDFVNEDRVKNYEFLNIPDIITVEKYVNDYKIKPKTRKYYREIGMKDETTNKQALNYMNLDSCCWILMLNSDVELSHLMLVIEISNTVMDFKIKKNRLSNSKILPNGSYAFMWAHSFYEPSFPESNIIQR